MQPKATQQAKASDAYLLILNPEEVLGEKVARDFAKILGWDLYIARQRLRLRAPQVLKKTRSREAAEKLFIELSALGLKVTLAAEKELSKIPLPLEVKGAKVSPDGWSFMPYEGQPLVFPFTQELLVVKGSVDKEILINPPGGFLRVPLKQIMVKAAKRNPVDPLYCTLADIYSPSNPRGARIWFHKFNFDILGERREVSPFLNFNHLLELWGRHFIFVIQDDNFKWLPKDLKARKERKIFSDLGLGTTKEQVVIDNLEQFNSYSQLRFVVQLSQKYSQ